jgi:hypothetical protein
MHWTSWSHSCRKVWVFVPLLSFFQSAILLDGTESRAKLSLKPEIQKHRDNCVELEEAISTQRILIFLIWFTTPRCLFYFDALLDSLSNFVGSNIGWSWLIRKQILPKVKSLRASIKKREREVLPLRINTIESFQMSRGDSWLQKQHVKPSLA